MSQPAQQRLTSVSFIAYLAMTFLTAVNDSMFRWLIVPIGKLQFQQNLGWDKEDAEAIVLSLGLGCFMLPFVLFAPWAGWAAEPACWEVACAAHGASECRFELRCDPV